LTLRDEITINLIHQVGQIDSITADKGYDQSRVYEATNDQMNEGDKINFYSRVNAVVSASDESELRQRILTLILPMKTVC
jgi:hypothetical protein